MPVIGRSPSFVVDNSGNPLGVISENLEVGIPPFKLGTKETNGSYTDYVYVQKDTRNQELTKIKSYGAGTRVLQLISNLLNKETHSTPVLATWTDFNSGGSPLRASLIEGALDPTLSYDSKTDSYILYYWVNAWSTSSSTNEAEPTLFGSVKPPDLADPNTFTQDAQIKPPTRSYLSVRDTPSWFIPLDPRHNPTGSQLQDETTEILANPNISSFWIAPWSDAFLFRFTEDKDPTGVIPRSPPSTYSPPTSPPVTPVTTPGFFDRFDQTSTPLQKPQQEILNVLKLYSEGSPLTPTDEATLIEYTLTPRRLMNLSRTFRVLMTCRGSLFRLNKSQVREVPRAITGAATTSGYTSYDEGKNYLIMNSPRPIAMFPRNINKVLSSRQKWTSYINGDDYFVTAPLSYKSPAVSTIDLTLGNPQIDFMIHDPSDNKNGGRTGLTLPDSKTPQSPYILPEQQLVYPQIPGISLVEILTNSSSWDY
jgi:hypothetical protein